jgi:hypothetical protein
VNPAHRSLEQQQHMHMYISPMVRHWQGMFQQNFHKIQTFFFPNHSGAFRLEKWFVDHTNP